MQTVCCGYLAVASGFSKCCFLLGQVPAPWNTVTVSPISKSWDRKNMAKYVLDN